MIMLHLSIYSETSLNLTPSIQESPLNRNIAFGPKSTYSYITNPFKLKSPLNQTFCPVLRWSGLEGFYCLPMIYPVNYCLNCLTITTPQRLLVNAVPPDFHVAIKPSELREQSRAEWKTVLSSILFNT